jgi:VWFA-related protein
VLLALAVPVCAAFAAPSAEPRPTELRESVRVEQILLDARVIDRHGQPIPDLDPDAFRVRIGGVDARIVAVDWIPETEALGADPDGQPALPPTVSTEVVPDPPGRSFVLLFQRHTHPSRARGMMSMARRAEEFLETLGPDDRVAVLVLDSHLTMMADFTDDHDAIREIVRGSVMPYRPASFVRDDGPSLSDHIDLGTLRDVYSPEHALLVLGEALREIPGPKSMLYIGWGLGFKVGGVIQMRPEYVPALAALTESRTTVFMLDITEADYHSLEGPMIEVARETGGFYLKTKYSSYFAMDMVERMVGGRYVLACEIPDVAPGPRVLRIGLIGHRGGQVLHRDLVEVPEPESR